MTINFKVMIQLTFAKSDYEEMHYQYENNVEAIMSMLRANLISDTEAEQMLDYNLNMYVYYTK